jgi:hypothetical protein
MSGEIRVLVFGFAADGIAALGQADKVPKVLTVTLPAALAA